MMSEKRFVVTEDANTKNIILLIDCERMWMYSFLAEEKEAVQKICDLFNELSDENRQLKEENEQLKKDVENLQEVVAELGATLLINGFEIKINNENLSELIDDEGD